MASLLAAAGCAGQVEPADFHGRESGALVEPESVRGTVGDQVGNGCSTTSVFGLGGQIAQEVACIHPGALSAFSAGDGIHLGPAVLPYLATDAVAALRKAAAQAGTLEVTSGFRTVAQQYLLYEWYQSGSCGIALAAVPGRSNHESGRAVDLANWANVIDPMARNGWAHDVPGDDVHFDHLDSASLDGADVQAFQRLWNRNHAEDPLVVDGNFGDGTRARLVASPAAGFAVGACAGGTAVDASDPAHFHSSGPWRASTSIAGYVGAFYLVMAPGDSGWASWSLPVASGRYEVTARFTPFSNRTSRAIYRVYVASGATPVVVPVDQRQGGHVSLGTFTLGPGASVSIDPSVADGNTIADAVVATATHP